MTVWGYVMARFTFSVFSLVSIWEDISNTQDSVLPHFKHLEVRHKYSATRCILHPPSPYLEMWLGAVSRV